MRNLIFFILSKFSSWLKTKTPPVAVPSLPLIDLQLNGVDVLDKETYVKGNAAIKTDTLFNWPVSVKGRGNTTWYDAEKKSYKVKFDSKQSVLGFPSDKEWALKANWFDKSLLREDVGFELGERIEREWTPRRRAVELKKNGEYYGLFLLTETIKAGTDRVNIDTKNGGYLIEANAKPLEEGDIRFQSRYSVFFDVKEGTVSPDIMKADFDAINDKLIAWDYDPITGYQSLFDLDKFVSWFLVNQVMLTCDAGFYSSVYLQKKNATSKLEMGPVWDFDLSSGNVSYSQTAPEGWAFTQDNFIQWVWRDKHFKNAFKAKWEKYIQEILTLPEYIKKKGEALQLPAKQNFTKWDILSKNVFPNTGVRGAYKAEVDYFYGWLDARIKWIDAEIKKL